MSGLVELYKFEKGLANNDVWSNEILEQIRSGVSNNPMSKHTFSVGENV